MGTAQTYTTKILHPSQPHQAVEYILYKDLYRLTPVTVQTKRLILALAILSCLKEIISSGVCRHACEGASPSAKLLARNVTALKCQKVVARPEQWTHSCKAGSASLLLHWTKLIELRGLHAGKKAVLV